MTERRIIYSSREAHDKPKEPIAPLRLKQIYEGEEFKLFLGFVRTLQNESLSRFCVSRMQNPKAKDPDLLFFEISGVTKGKFPEIIYLGQMMGKGSIEITNRFAAETHGYRVLQFGEKKRLEVKE